MNPYLFNETSKNKDDVQQEVIPRFCKDCVHCDQQKQTSDYWMCRRPKRHETLDLVTGERLVEHLPAITCRDERTYTARWSGCNPEGHFFKQK